MDATTTMIGVLLAVSMGGNVAQFALSRHRRRVRPASAHPGVLLDRDGFDEALSGELWRAAALGRTLSVAIIDFDGLAALNNAMGYAVVDELVEFTGDTIVTRTRAADLCARLGGGSFAVAFPDADAEAAHAAAERLRNDLQRDLARRGACASLGIRPTVRIGVATRSADDEWDITAAADILQLADGALAIAAMHGGNRTIIWTSDARDELERAVGDDRSSRDARLATVLSLAEALDLRDADTANHSRNVGRYAELMARELGMSPAHVERVRIAGLLHDIGKIGVPDSILRKPAKLDEAEWALMQQHPEIGARMLASIDAEDIRTWVLAHHERPDCRGYPFGIGADDIPVEARILSVADTYEAMTSDRVYRAAPGPRIAREELARCVGTQFDGAVVAAFLRVLDRVEPLPVVAELTDVGEEAA